MGARPPQKQLGSERDPRAGTLLVKARLQPLLARALSEGRVPVRGQVRFNPRDARTHVYTFTHRHACRDVHNTCTHAGPCVVIHACLHKCAEVIHACMQAWTQTHVCTHMHACTHAGPQTPRMALSGRDGVAPRLLLIGVGRVGGL